MNDKFKDFYRQYISYIAVGLISIIYILTAVLEIDETGKSIQKIIADGVVAFLFGININHLLGVQGLMNGDKNEKVVSTLELYGSTIEEVEPYIEELDGWCEEQNANNLKRQRTKMLSRVGLKYSDCFDEDGTAKGFIPTYGKSKESDKAERKKCKMYKKAVWLKLTELTAGTLTSEGDKPQDIYDFGKTKAQFVTRENSKDIIGKIVCALVFGYYGIALIKDFSWSLLIWTALQVGIFLVMGLIRMFRFYIFVTDEYRGRIIKKIDNLIKFKNYKMAGEFSEQKVGKN